jgi:hypothetical protein
MPKAVAAAAVAEYCAHESAEAYRETEAVKFRNREPCE